MLTPISSLQQGVFKIGTRLQTLKDNVECWVYSPYGLECILMLPREWRWLLIEYVCRGNNDVKRWVFRMKELYMKMNIIIVCVSLKKIYVEKNICIVRVFSKGQQGNQIRRFVLGHPRGWSQTYALLCTFFQAM